MKTEIFDRIQMRRARLSFGWVEVLWYKGKVVYSKLRSRYRGKADRKLGKKIEQVWRYGLKRVGFQFDEQGLSSFARTVLRRAAKIRFGEVMSYGELAIAVGKPDAARAVGQVMAHNPFPLFFPCHRVIAHNGRLGGFTGGLGMKIRLLEFEGWQVKGRGRNARVIKRGI
ncbi:MAG: methylated-DNA--[protein]-cysteine S-methyltransferase [bacterium]